MAARCEAVDVRVAPESRYYGYSVPWENDNTLVIDTKVGRTLVLTKWDTAQLHGRKSRSATRAWTMYTCQLTVTVDEIQSSTRA